MTTNKKQVNQPTITSILVAIAVSLFCINSVFALPAEDKKIQGEDYFTKEHRKTVAEMKSDFSKKLDIENLGYASYKGYTKKMDTILKKYPQNEIKDIINSNTESMYLSAFEIACKYGIEPSVRYFVDNYEKYLIKNPNRAKYGRYYYGGDATIFPVKLVVDGGHKDVLDILYKAGFPLRYNLNDTVGEILFRHAIFLGHLDIAEYILNRLTEELIKKHPKKYSDIKEYRHHVVRELDKAKPMFIDFVLTLLVNIEDSQERDERGKAGLKFLLKNEFNPFQKEEKTYFEKEEMWSGSMCGPVPDIITTKKVVSGEDAIEWALKQGWDAGVKFFAERRYITEEMINKYAPKEKAETYKQTLSKSDPKM